MNRNTNTNQVALALDHYRRRDAVTLFHEDEDRLVGQVLTYTDPNDGKKPYYWLEYELQPVGGGAINWLSVEYDDEEWSTVLFDQRLDPASIGFQPGQLFPDFLVANGTTYKLKESGKMRVGLADTPTSWEGSYADYSDGVAGWLGIEVYPDPTDTPRESEVEVWTGRDIDPQLIDFYAQAEPKERPGLLVSRTYVSRPVVPQPIGRALRPIEQQYGGLRPDVKRRVFIACAIAGLVILLLIALIAI